jgi:hypothetical protein
MEKAGARTLRFAMNRVGLVEEPEPKPIRNSVDQPHQKPVDDVPDQGTEQVAAVLVRPIDRLALQERQERQRSEKPPEEAVT